MKYDTIRAILLNGEAEALLLETAGIAELLADYDALLALLKDIQWAAGGQTSDAMCPNCSKYREWEEPIGRHKPTCLIARALETGGVIG